jgi:hypothetical protein
MYIESSKITPQITFDVSRGLLEIIGRSIPENSVAFYSDLIQEIMDYSEAPKALTTVKIQLDYFNTTSSKSILEILKKIEGIFKNGNEVKVMWFYDENDEDMIDAGEDYQAIVKVPFEIIQVEPQF